MNRPPLIGLPGRRIMSEGLNGWPEPLHGLEVDLYLASYAQGVVEAGGLPVHIPLDVEPEAIIPHLDGLVLTGGADVEPARYGAGAHPELITPEPERDQLEFGLLAAAEACDLPVLGVCRGLQIINVAHGGTLAQHVPEHLRFDVPYTDPVHPVHTVE
ncbi:MAG: gamma-glutamyl-gamma-aminobutyrate hydrolase family protein, partial [Actinomycetota bacterium]